MYCTFQAVQILLADWLLTTRTEVWQDEQTDTQGGGEVTTTAACQTELLAFQHDLTSLRKLSQHVKQAMPKVHPR